MLSKFFIFETLFRAFGEFPDFDRSSPGHISTFAPETRKNPNYAAHSHTSRSRLRNERRHAEIKAKNAKWLAELLSESKTQAAAQPRGTRRDSCKRDAGHAHPPPLQHRASSPHHTPPQTEPPTMAAITTRKIEAIVHTKIDAARRRTVAKTIALDRLSAFLGDAAPALQPPALPWVDLEIRPAFCEPVEICVDCPEKATNGPAFKVRFPRLVRWLRCSSRMFDGLIVTTSRRWRLVTTSRRWRLTLAIRLATLVATRRLAFLWTSCFG